MSDDKVVLQAKKVTYYSQKDESAFFNWLRKIRCIENYRGQGDTLYITVKESSVDERSLDELYAIFKRYRIDRKQLLVFENKQVLGSKRKTK